MKELEDEKVKERESKLHLNVTSKYSTTYLLSCLASKTGNMNKDQAN